jgi:hypothetical protein
MNLIIWPEAWGQWLAEAERHGFGKYAFGSLREEGDRAEHLTIHFHTLVPAGYYKQAAPPILFDRNAAGEIVLPGRWWQDYVAAASRVKDNTPEDLRALAQELQSSDMVNASVPAQAHTRLVELNDLEGRLVPQEVLLPGTEAFVPFPPEWRSRVPTPDEHV